MLIRYCKTMAQENLPIFFLHFSIIGSEESVVFYELHICVKDSCFGRDDKLIGVSVMQLKDIQNQGISRNELNCLLWNRIISKAARIPS